MFQMMHHQPKVKHAIFPKIEDLSLDAIKENIQSNFELYESLKDRSILFKTNSNIIGKSDLEHASRTFITFRDNPDKLDYFTGKKKVTVAAFKKMAIKAIENHHATNFPNANNTYHLDAIEVIRKSGKELFTDPKILYKIHRFITWSDLIPEFVSIMLNNNLYHNSSIHHINLSFFQKIAYNKEEIEAKFKHGNDLNKYVISLQEEISNSGFDTSEVLMKLMRQMDKSDFRGRGGYNMDRGDFEQYIGDNES